VAAVAEGGTVGGIVAGGFEAEIADTFAEKVVG
jgi:hypothetical protein